MKKIGLLLLLILASSCVSTKSTLKTIDENAVRPPIRNGAYIFSEYSTEPKYGIDEDFPINIGIINTNSEEINVGYFFKGLQGPNGEKIIYKKTDTCCPFPTKYSNVGAGMISIYEVYFEGSTKKMTFYFNIYEKGKIVCPKGFEIKKQPETK